MNLPAVLEKNEHFEVKNFRQGYGSTSYCLQPYTLWPETIHQTIIDKGIKMPFKRIVTMDMGTATCPHCGAKYAGNQVRCTQKVLWTQPNGAYHWSKGPPDPKNSRWTNWEHCYKECDADLVWEHQEEFNLQKGFFDFVAFMSNVPSESVSMITSYAQYLQPGSAEEYRLRKAENDLMQCKIAMENVFGALDQIAQKMNQAGSALTFNRY